jgi:hypothetical protein
MCDNAFTYNKKSSTIYKDALALLNSFDSHLENYAIVGKEMSQIKDILSSLSSTPLEDGSDVAGYFHSLPPSSQTEYYEKVKNPISLSDIIRKVEDLK